MGRNIRNNYLCRESRKPWVRKVLSKCVFWQRHGHVEDSKTTNPWDTGKLLPIHMTRLKRDGKGLLRSLSIYEWMQCLQRPANVASSCKMFTARHCFLQRLTNPPSPHPTLYPVNMLKYQVVAVREPHLTLYTYLCVCLLFVPLSLLARIPGPRALKLTAYMYTCICYSSIPGEELG